MNRKPILLFLSLALAATAFTQDASPKINFTSVAVPINRALAEISKQASVRLEAVPAISDEILILRIKEISLDELMKRIAAATSAEWQPMDGGYRLVPNTILRRQEEQAEKSAYVAGLAKTLDQMVKSLNPPPPAKTGTTKTKGQDQEVAQEMAAQFGFGASQTPAGKAVIRLMQGIGAQNLGSIDAKSRIVYSTNPTRMQRALPGNATAILAQMVAEHNTYALKRQKERENVENTEMAEQMKKYKEMFGNFEDDDKPVEGTPTKAILVCSRQEIFGGLSVVLKVYNEKGQVVITGQQTLANMDSNFSQFVEEKVAEAKGEPKPAQKAPAEKPIEFSATTKELQSSTNIMEMASGGTKMSDELKAKMLHPEMFDPLSFVDSEALIEIATRRNEQLVANLPDEMQTIFGMVAAGGNDKLTPTAYLSQIKNNVAVTEANGWLTAKPSKPAEAREKRFNREALGAFIRAADSKGACSLDDLAAYALRSTSPMENQGALRYIMMFAPNAMQTGLAGLTSWDMLRFYGSLTPTNRKNLIDGARISFSQLSPVQATAVKQMLYGPEEALTVDEDEKKDENGLTKMMKRMFMRALGGDYRTEPTEIMPNGLPAEGFIQLAFTNSHVAKAAGNVPAMLSNAPLGAEELAMLKFMSESESMQQFAAMMPHIEEVKLGNRAVYDFKFVVGQGVSMSQTLNDDSFDSKAAPIKMANLPADFQKQIQDQMAMLKKLPFFDPAFFGGGKQAVPPL